MTMTASRTMPPFHLCVAVCAATLLLLGAAAAVAGRVASQASASTQGDDLRVQAWRVWIAGRDHDESAQPMLEAIVAERIDGEPWHPLVDYGLDALIQLRAALPPDLLARIVEERPVEGLILLSHVDDGSADGVLLRTLARAQSHEWFAAANMVVRRRPAGAVAHLLAGLRIAVTITVSDTGRAGSGSGFGGAIGCGMYSRQPGMPPWPSYGLTSDADAGDVVLALGPTPVYYQRWVSAAGVGPSRGGLTIDGPTAADRLRYVEAMTGRSAAFPDGVHHSVRRNPTLDTAALGARLRRDLEHRYAAFVRDLVATGFVSPAEAAALALEVAVTVVDADAPLAQP